MTETGPLKGDILARAPYSLQRVNALFVGGLYSRGRSKDGTNLTQTAAALKQAASSGAVRHAVFIVGVGVWDLVHSTEEDVVRSFGLRFPSLLREVLRAAQSYASAEVVVRNVFTSYTAGLSQSSCRCWASLTRRLGAASLRPRRGPYRLRCV